jgi:hypothetical protein
MSKENIDIYEGNGNSFFGGGPWKRKKSLLLLSLAISSLRLRTVNLSHSHPKLHKGTSMHLDLEGIRSLFMNCTL